MTAMQHKFPKKKPSAARRNHWRKRSSDDYVTYPKLEPLPYLKESRLIQAAQAGNIAARNEVWMHYARLALSIVNRFDVPDTLLADTVQEGVMGLNKAIEKFDVERHDSFATYAWRWIYLYMQRFLGNNFFLVRLPERPFADYMRFQRELRDGVEPGAEAFLCAHGLAADHQRRRCMICIHAAVHPRPIHYLKSGSHPEVYDTFEHDEAHRNAIFDKAIRSLRDRDRKIITKRNGLFGEPKMTLAELGHELGLTRERIRQIQVKAEANLGKRFAMLAKGLTPKTDRGVP